MKTLMTCAFAVLIAFGSFAAGPTVSEKVRKTFETTFTDAENISWSKAGNIYSVRFTQQSITSDVRYDEEGNFMSSRRYYQAAALPVDIQCRLQKKLPGKTVFGVTELSAGSQVLYFIQMEDAVSWTSIKVTAERDIEILEKINKQ
jgi:hypothetical protein